MSQGSIEAIRSALGAGTLIPYLGPSVLALTGDDCPVPTSADQLVARLTAKASVPHKIRNNLSAAAQFIENFKHRKTVAKAMAEAFDPKVPPTVLHRFFAAQPKLPLLVHAWYDDLPQQALAGRPSWGIVQGVSQSEHFGNWVHYLRPDGTRVDAGAAATSAAEGMPPAVAPVEAANWATLLYQPLGSVRPAANFLVSDTDYVEVLTEIDIQTPIPEPVQNIRRGRHFLFLGCRFANQLERTFARQIMKRSSDKHWAVLPDEPTRNEARFLVEQNIERIAIPLDKFIGDLVQPREATANGAWMAAQH
ncbi:SIR2 family protein [Hyphomicrobium sp. NDB2Meth4]|uniref:SIR2 family NAD-dependent protein deacylase n=1 Tax=Hyphomicrobium sp. NDB2Meth4 TaxID=1892846 RepID=UPI00093159A6|nr:SIR2 family protein [Hyphomicrobium sp. NDB2Meth4]